MIECIRDVEDGCLAEKHELPCRAVWPAIGTYLLPKVAEAGDPDVHWTNEGYVYGLVPLVGKEPQSVMALTVKVWRRQIKLGQLRLEDACEWGMPIAGRVRKEIRQICAVLGRGKPSEWTDWDLSAALAVNELGRAVR